MIGLVITAAVVLALSVYLIGIYNGLVGLRENVKVGWADIDMLCKRRHDELPKLVETCKRYMQFEQDSLDKVMRARGAVNRALSVGDVSAMGAAEQQLRMGMTRLFAAAENHQQLKADVTFVELKSRVAALEDSIAQRRGLYNAQVDLNNLRVGIFPDVVIAQQFGFKTARRFEFATDDQPAIGVGALFRA